MSNNLTNFEKLVVGTLLLIVVLAVVYRYIGYNSVDDQMIYLTGLLLSALVVRKGLSYFKPESYNKATKHIDTPVKEKVTISKGGNDATI